MGYLICHHDEAYVLPGDSVQQQCLDLGRFQGKKDDFCSSISPGL